MFTLTQWIARLTKGYIRHTGKKPDGLAHLKIKMEAAQKVKDQSKVVKGDFNPKEEWWKARSRKTDLALQKQKKYERLVKAEEEKAAKDPDYISDIIDPEDFASGGIARVGMAGGGAMWKIWQEFIEKLFIKASNDIRLGKGKWKGLTQDQWITQHDNLTKMLKKWEWSGKKRLPEGVSEYLGMNDLQISKAIQDATKKVKSPLQKEVSERTGKVFDPKTDQYVTPVDERTALKQKYPGLTDELLNKILVDDNPQRKAEVLATMDEYLKLKEVGKGEEEAFDIMVKSIKKPTKHASGGIAGQLHMNQGGRTSSGLNYLLGEDDQNVRVPFKLGGIDKGRRAFMKWIAGLTGAGIAAGTGLLKWGKVAGKGKTVIKAGDHIIQGTPGMPDWYIPLVNRIVREGDDVSKKLGTVEREIVHTKKISPTEEVTVYRNTDTGNVRVEYGDNVSYDNVHLEYRAGEVIDEGKHAGKKTDPEFSASETEPEVVNWDGDIEWSGVNEVNKVDDLVTDTSKLKEFGQKKLTHRDKVLAKKKQKYQKKLQTDQQEQLDYVEKRHGPFPDPGDYSLDADEMAEVIEKYRGKAGGGRVSLSAGGLAGLLGE